MAAEVIDTGEVIPNFQNYSEFVSLVNAVNMAQFETSKDRSVVHLTCRFSTGYHRCVPQRLNGFGLPDLPFYRTRHVSGILNLKPCTFVWRLKHGFYPEVKPQHDARGRMFSISDIEYLLKREHQP
jgi:hypothetical protein